MLLQALATGYGTVLALVLSLRATLDGHVFSPPTKRFYALLASYRNTLWDLSKPIPLMESRHAHHNFIRLQAGTAIHYLTTQPSVSSTPVNASGKKDLIIFLHGWPDSGHLWLKTWRALLTANPSLHATLVAPDLPGFGGSDGLSSYSATSVLDTIVELIYLLRQRYTHRDGKVLLVSHDWGAAIVGRLAVEAPAVADSFILINGPISAFASWNVQRRAHSGVLHLKRLEVSAAWRQLGPVLAQLAKSYYIFVFRLPSIVSFTFWSGQRFFLRSVAQLAITGRGPGALPGLGPAHDDRNEETIAEHLAVSLGPGEVSKGSALAESVQAENGGIRVYSSDVKQRVTSRAGWGNAETESVRYYRDGLADETWRMEGRAKEMCEEMDRPRAGSGETDGEVKRRVTIIWGRKDPALDWRVMVDGIEEWSKGMVKVRWIERAGHWVPCQEGTVGVEMIAEEIENALKAAQ